jgi:hypothetical protein
VPKPKPHQFDISIGQDKWITFIMVPDAWNHGTEVDEILKPIEPFFDLLEIHCVAECCGIAAYAFWPDDIATAARRSTIPNLAEAVETVRQRIAETQEEVFVSPRMNHYFHPETLMQLLDHIAHCLRHG